MATSYLVVHFLRKLFISIIIVQHSPMCVWHILKMMATVHDALRYRDIMGVITYHFDAPTFIVHQMFFVNGKDTVRGPILLFDAEVV